MVEGKGQNEEGVVRGRVYLESYIDLVESDVFIFFGLVGLKQFVCYLVVNEEVFTYIGDSDYKVGFFIVGSYDCMLVETDGFSSFFGSGNFCQEGICDEDFQDGGEYQLGNKKYDGQWVFFIDVAEVIVNGGLRFKGEEEGFSERVYLYYIGGVVGRRVQFQQVFMSYSYQILYYIKEELGVCKGCREEQKFVALLYVDEGCLQVFEVEEAFVGNVFYFYVVAIIFCQDFSFSYFWVYQGSGFCLSGLVVIYFGN